MLRFAFLGSGSRGNALLVESGDTRLLIDCGFSMRETARRLTAVGRSIEDLAGIVVTHEHADHVSGVYRLAERHGLPVWMTPGTQSALARRPSGTRSFSVHEDFAVDGIGIRPVAVPHDAREPSQFVFTDGAVRLGLLTDAGHVTPHIRRSLDGCDALILECNHDRRMLEEGPYPAALKRRVGGRLGHLSNCQAAGLAGEIDMSRMRHLIAAHVSDKNNSRELARRALEGAVGCEPGWIEVAEQDEPSPWYPVG